MDRRRFLTTVGAALGSAAVLGACSSDSADTVAATTATDDSTTTSGRTTSTTARVAAPPPTPPEIAGPFPSDGTNDNGNGRTADFLHADGAVRRDIRADLDGSHVQPGMPIELTMKIVDPQGAARAGAAVYVWHCNKEGVYSQYDSAMLGGDHSARSYLRGVQVADADGEVRFATILPGRYQGRAFHIHFEVYADAQYLRLLLTSQVAARDGEIATMYRAADYTTALRNDTDNAADGVFADGVDHQLLRFGGDTRYGITASYTAVV